ncbi:MAG: ribosome maturation factor RimM [Lachnospiraceae bacterium]|nr:ribosome maturation factor RimM [Lachnospiraceae bacterium]
MEDLLQVGVISSSHGVKGEVKVFPTTDDKGRFKKLKYVLADFKDGMKKREIESVKFFKQMVILKFKDINDRDAADRLRGISLLVDRENAVELEEDEYFIADLIGMNVYDDHDKEIGELYDVLSTGANDVYVVRKKDGKEILLPAIKECILSIDVRSMRMQVKIPEGLEE